MPQTEIKQDEKTISGQDPVILIPALNPEENLIELTDSLTSGGFGQIIVVDDGSKKECLGIFRKITENPHCKVLHHFTNLGKGRALKTGFNYFLEHYYDTSCGIVTVDSDGQHTVEDIRNIARKLRECPDCLVLGSRNFSGSEVPFKSRYGNLITKNVFRFFTGMNVSDTQTGLRGIPKDFVISLMNTVGERYEFETRMILECKRRNVPIQEVRIKTVYLNGNQSSHFKPFADSFKIYAVFLKFISSSLISSAVDIVLFSLFAAALKPATAGYIVFATILARLLSSLLNYNINQRAVFKSGGKTRVTICKYYAVATVQMLLSAYGVTLLYSIMGGWEVAVKILVDMVLFLFSYKMQSIWVFK